MNQSNMQSANKQDLAIDATLAALRQAAQPPSGLEQRVLQNFTARSAEAPRAGWRTAWFAAPVTVCAVLVMFSILALRHTHRAPGPVANNAPVQSEVTPVDNPRAAVQRLAHETQDSPRRQARARRLAVAREFSVAAHADTPPPPAPLTEQERLLLQIARSGDPSQRAMLNPEVLAREESEADTQFRNFFAKSSNIQTRNP